ncbi:iron chaperone [Leifsonia sp. 2TAF2]|uniref:iron chaperone n=1 Tax=Leifsonia sp. 2TAF2 TaxID=3233009 RepID=UPI003F96BBEC
MARGVEADTVEEYLDRIGEPFGAALRTVRDRIAAIVPESEQVISYRVPTFRVNGKALVGLSVTSRECSLLLMSPPAASELAGTLPEGSITGATIHFPPEQPLSEATLRLILDVRLRELGLPLTPQTPQTPQTPHTPPIPQAPL